MEKICIPSTLAALDQLLQITKSFLLQVPLGSLFPILKSSFNRPTHLVLFDVNPRCQGDLLDLKDLSLT